MENLYSRRRFLKQSALFAGATASLPLLPASAADTNASAVPSTSTPVATSPASPLTVDASARPAPASTEGFHMGTATAPGGHTLTLDSRSLVRDGHSWLPISGEFHYARCPANEWRDELLKIKAGGVSIVASYIFWIHHEEVQDTWDWSGQRDLRQFLKTAQAVGLDVLLRIGPWCHGEVRNGGFPDWIQKLGDTKVLELRRDDPAYLGYVKKLYAQVSQQTSGLLWKDGGPLIAIQVENEYSGPTEHLLTLKQMARDAGIDVPLYTCTGWGQGGPAVFGELVPFSGSYVDGFWDRSLNGGGYGGVLRFSGFRQRGNAAAMGSLGNASAAPTLPPAKGVYPSCTCELGGGMMASYHRRVYMWPEDTESLALVRLGSGVNLLGFYMYHGGENPEGKLTNLNETQATNYWNDLPVKNYDFQAPIGSLGQEREHYHFLRLLGLFLADFGSGLAGLTTHTPTGRGGPVNWAVRSDGSSAYLYVSQYNHLGHGADAEDVQFRVHLADGDVTLPSAPVKIPYNHRFFWPINLDLGGVKLVYATAQPITRVTDGGVRYTVFKQTAGVPVEFVFADGTIVESTTGENVPQAAQLATETTNGSNPGATVNEPTPVHIRNVPASTESIAAAIRLKGSDGSRHVIIVLDEAVAFDLWKGSWQGKDRLFLTHAALLLDGSTIRLRSDNPADFSLAIFPAPAGLKDGGSPVHSQDNDLFRRFAPDITTPAAIPTVVESVQPAGPARVVPIAGAAPGRRQGMAQQPEDADFAQAAVWRVKFPAGIDPSRNLRLRVTYTGDILRAYQGEKLLADDFYAARPLEIGIHRFGPSIYQDGLLLKILPLREDAPVYITDRSQLKFDPQTHTALSLGSVEVIETIEVRLAAGT